MQQRFRFCAAIITAFACFSIAQAQSDSTAAGQILLPAGLTIRPHTYAYFEAGEIESGNLNYWGYTNINGYKYGIDHVWTEDADIEFGFNSLYKERLAMEISLGAKLAFSYPTFFDGAHATTKYMSNYIYFDEAYAGYHWGRAESPWLMAQIGYFKFKYNPDVRNLGEYLFRTGTYPIYFDMSFDTPFQRLLGAHVQSNLFNSLKMDLLLSSSTLFPTMNWSLSGLASYDVAALHFVDIGAGVDFSDLFDVYTNHTFPAAGGDPTSLNNDNQNFKYIKTNGDTGWYTFQGTKIMGRLSINPQAFFSWKYLGKNDLRLYAEADVIGLQNYPDSGITGTGNKQLVAPSYDTLTQRIPVMVGFNFPTYPLFAYGITPEMLLWKLQDKYDIRAQLPVTIASLAAGFALSWLQERFHVNSQLDVLNLELEWFGAQYYNDESNVFSNHSMPLPNDVTYFGTTGPQKSQVKWSLYTKKSFLNGHFAVTSQVGLDHLRLSSASYDYTQLWNELLITRNDWWWAFKTSWMF